MVFHVLVLSRVGMAFPMSLLWCCIHHVHSAPWGQHVFPCAMVSPMFPVPSLLSLLRDCAGQEEPPAQSPFHPNPPQLLLGRGLLGQRVGMGTTPGLCPHTLLQSLLAWAHSWRCCGNNQRCLSATTFSCIPVLPSALLHLPLLSPLDTRQDGHGGQQCSLCQDHSLGTRDTQWG